MWHNARSKSDWASFAPVLNELLSLAKEKAKCIDPSKVPELFFFFFSLFVPLPSLTVDVQSAYDVMLDLNERGMTSTRIDEIFNELKAVRPPIQLRLSVAYALNSNRRASFL